MDDEQRQSIARQVLAAREAAGMNQRELCKRAGVAQKTLVAVENGRSVRPGSLRKIQDALGIEPISEQVARGLDPASVHLTLDIVRMWLLGMPTDEREQAASDLVGFIMARKTGE